MIEDENVKKYIASMNKIILNGNPKYLSYVCKEYMKYKKNNPVLAMILENMIRKEAREPGSVYAILIDNDNGINLDAASDISKITNVADFIKSVDALSAQNIDFGDLTSDELIIEGMEIAENLAREIEDVENSIDTENITEISSVESEIDRKVENALGKITVLGLISTKFKSIIEKTKQKLSLTKSGLKERIKNRSNKSNEDNNLKTSKQVEKSKVKTQNNDFIPKVIIDEEKVIKQMNKGKLHLENSKNSRIGMSSASDDFDDTSDDDNDDIQEDDEPDI